MRARAVGLGILLAQVRCQGFPAASMELPPGYQLAAGASSRTFFPTTIPSITVTGNAPPP